MVAVGADLYGWLPMSTIGRARKAVMVGSIEEVRSDCAHSNSELVKKLKPDDFQDELHRLTTEDAKLGRMSWPREADLGELESKRLCPRCFLFIVT